MAEKGNSINGNIVFYNGKKYTIIHKYESGYCEIRETGVHNTELIHISELKFITN
ncbi:hypothetical protein [Peribacillus sp. SCS-155]|uniref:hypothetical protein n=1 Tax=Peribacillus sedimenti TaxID=3115297 RepID=UPI0039062A25